MIYYEYGFDIILFLMRFYDNTIQNGGKMKNDIIIGREEGSDSFLKNKNNVLFLICLALLILIPITVYASSKYSQEAEAVSKAYTSSLYISEYMTANTHYFDESGKSSDFIEIHNGSKEVVNLRGYVLAKDDKTYMFPAQILEPDEYFLVWLGKGSGASHADFKLSALGSETVSLKNNRGKVIDEIVTKTVERNFSVVRALKKDLSKKESVSESPTPGFPNSEDGALAYAQSRFIENETGIFINEVMASNETVITDEFGDCTDYVELYNSTKSDINIGLFGLTDELSNPFKFQFPENTVIKKGSCLLLFLSSSYKSVDENGEKVYAQSSNGNFLVPFSINKTQEKLCLCDKSGRFIESVTISDAKKDEALIRTENGEYQRTFEVSPGYPNTKEGIKKAQKNLGLSVSDKDIYISEASSRNTAYAQVGGKYYDWIELYNPTDKDISLKGYSLSDDAEEHEKFVFGDVTIPAGGYKVVYATDEELAGNISTGFKLNSSCNAILFSPEGKRLDMVRLTELLKNVSKGREKGSSSWSYFTSPTPGSENKDGFSRISSPPVASEKSGQYSGVSSLKITLSGDGDIYYTLDGSVPTENSKKYSGEIEFTKTGVLRAVCKGENSIMSSVSSYTYIINENHKMDVVSMVSDPDGIFSPSSGIYVHGNNASSEFPYNGANFWQGWKRECNLSLLPLSDEEAGFSIDCETSVFGGMTRAYDKRSLKFKFRDIYGSGKLHYKLFENLDIEEFDSIVVRASGQDTYKSMMRDDLITSLIRDDLDVLASRPVVFYINGEYFGIFYIREKASENYVASHYNVSPDSVDLLQANGIIPNAGTNEKWNELKDFVRSHDMSVDANYAYVEERVDLKNYADYIVAELYTANADQGNIRYFRSSENDGKFRWLLYDTDLGFQLELKNTAWELLNPAGTGADDNTSTFLINGLLKNKKFRKLFIDRLEYQMDNVWNSERVLKRIDEMADIIRDEVPRNSARWPKCQGWESYVEALRDFARNRPSQLRDELKNDYRVRNIIALTDEELSRCFKEAGNGG